MIFHFYDTVLRIHKSNFNYARKTINSAKFITISAGTNLLLNQEGSQAKNLPRLRLKSMSRLQTREIIRRIMTVNPIFL